MRAVLDTSVLLSNVVGPLPGELAVSAATMAELHFGVLVADNNRVRATRLRKLRALQRRFDPLPIDDAVAESYGELASAIVSAGRQPRARVMDILIAATAHAHDAQLYTLNPKDFKGIDDLVQVVTV